MMTPETVRELAKAQAISAAHEAAMAAMALGGAGALALPKDFALEDLERFMPLRRRQRGSMRTAAPEDFAAYVEAHRAAGATVFVDQPHMHATAVLNLGTPAEPGHADHTATLRAEASACYTALLRMLDRALPQSAVAEWLEDWQDLVACQHDDEPLETRRAIGAVRAITVEGLRKLESTEGQLSASRSTLDAVRAHAGELKLPTRIAVTCVPYAAVTQPRAFVLRVSVHADAKPSLTLRLAKREEHEQAMAQEMAAAVRAALPEGLPVHVGEYTRA